MVGAATSPIVRVVRRQEPHSVGKNWLKCESCPQSCPHGTFAAPGFTRLHTERLPPAGHGHGQDGTMPAPPPDAAAHLSTGRTWPGHGEHPAADAAPGSGQPGPGHWPPPISGGRVRRAPPPPQRLDWRQLQPGQHHGQRRTTPPPPDAAAHLSTFQAKNAASGAAQLWLPVNCTGDSGPAGTAAGNPHGC